MRNPPPGEAPPPDSLAPQDDEAVNLQKLSKRKAAQEEEAAWLAKREEAAKTQRGLGEGLTKCPGERGEVPAKPSIVSRLASAPSGGLELAWDSGYEPLETRQSCLRLVTTPRPKAPPSPPSPASSTTSPSSLAFPSSPTLPSSPVSSGGSPRSLAWEYGTEEGWRAATEVVLTS